MFDTNIFNHILDGNITIREIEDIKYFVTQIQLDELNATKDERRRNQLLMVFKNINQVRIPTESALWDVSDWDDSKWDGMVGRILEQLEEKKPHHPGNPADALIGVTVIKTGITLVSDDGALWGTVKKLGGEAVSLSDFLKETEGRC